MDKVTQDLLSFMNGISQKAEMDSPIPVTASSLVTGPTAGPYQACCQQIEMLWDDCHLLWTWAAEPVCLPNG